MWCTIHVCVSHGHSEHDVCVQRAQRSLVLYGTLALGLLSQQLLTRMQAGLVRLIYEFGNGTEDFKSLFVMATAGPW